jgi:hypothetical protein
MSAQNMYYLVTGTDNTPLYCEQPSAMFGIRIQRARTREKDRGLIMLLLNASDLRLRVPPRIEINLIVIIFYFPFRHQSKTPPKAPAHLSDPSKSPM